ERIEHAGPRAEHEQPAHHRAHLAAELATVVHYVPVVADALNVLHTAQAQGHRVEHRVEIALPIRRPLTTDLAACGEERSAQADQAVDACLEGAQPHLVAHVG